MTNPVAFRIIWVTAIMATSACGSGSHKQVASLAATQSSVAQPTEILSVQRRLSSSKTMVYVRQVRFDEKNRLYQVQDFFENGQIQMDATYSALNKQVKEDYQCNYSSNTKEGEYREWYANGKLRYLGRFKHGREEGIGTEFASNGQKETEAVWKNGRLHGTARFWTEAGNPPLVLKFRKGVNQTPRKIKYAYLAYTPKHYEDLPEKQWPMIIYLHGGSDRGTNLTQVYSSGVPDQIYRGREFPFIVVAPQCPPLLRWTTDDWFEAFYHEVTARFRVDSNRVYLTGVSLGGEGTWYLAARYPDLFAAIAPISGFTSRTAVIEKNLKNLAGLPIWAFHGARDLVVPVAETQRMIDLLKYRNPRLKLTIEPDVGHWIHWSVYPGDELYEWFLSYDRRQH